MKLSSLSLFLTLQLASSFGPQTLKTPVSVLRAAAISKEEDLELTRKVIMSHMNITPSNDLMIRAALGREPVERTPVWLFRQAGRHLPEYQAYKEKTGRNFLEMLKYPEDVAECTLQPVRRYPIDAAILFSDILVIAEALNIEVTMPGGVGILVPNPLKGPEEVATRIPSLDQITPSYIQEKLGTVIESVKLIRKKMEQENISVPLIGFSGAPFALLFYMIGGSSRKNKDIGMKWLTEYPKESQQLLDVLTKIIIEYMSAQVEAGAHMLQLFEAMGMMLEQNEFEKFALPCLEKIGKQLKSRYPDVPLMVFARGAGHVNEKLSHMDFDVVTMDGEVDRRRIRELMGERCGLQGSYDPKELMGERCGLQGSYDPKELIEENGKSPETVKESAQLYLDVLGPQRLIANLGEGLGGKESPALVKVFVDTIHQYSEELIKKDKNY